MRKPSATLLRAQGFRNGALVHWRGRITTYKKAA
jgi:hypothetical protein